MQEIFIFTRLILFFLLSGCFLAAQEPQRHVALSQTPTQEILCTRQAFSETADINKNRASCPSLQNLAREQGARGKNSSTGAGAPSKKDNTAPAERDQQELHRLRASLETAFEQNRFDLLAPHLDENFSGVMLYQKFGSFKDFEDVWAKIVKDIGKKFIKGFRVRVVPGSLRVSGNQARAHGSTNEAVLTRFGAISFRTNWEAKLEKKGGRWKLLSMTCNLDASHAISSALASIVQKIWLDGQISDTEAINTLRSAS